MLSAAMKAWAGNQTYPTGIVIFLLFFPAGLKLPNDWGLYTMNGSVME
jgi:hypothetical protein